MKRQAGGAQEGGKMRLVCVCLYLVGLKEKKGARAKLGAESGDLTGFRGHGGLT